MQVFNSQLCRIEFTVGNKPVTNFRMIERHYFRDHCLKNFDFHFGFCMPSSRNTCEHIYKMPELTDEESELIFLLILSCCLVTPVLANQLAALFIAIGKGCHFTCLVCENMSGYVYQLGYWTCTWNLFIARMSLVIHILSHLSLREWNEGKPIWDTIR